MSEKHEVVSLVWKRAPAATWVARVPGGVLVSVDGNEASALAFIPMSAGWANQWLAGKTPDEIESRYNPTSAI